LYICFVVDFLCRGRKAAFYSPSFYGRRGRLERRVPEADAFLGLWVVVQ
jgi:hypothetical protein